MITVKQSGSLNRVESFLQKMINPSYMRTLRRYGEAGVEALREATPRDTGTTAESWGYEIEATKDGFSIHWTNSNVNDGLPIALLIQYGHGTRSGAYVEGVDYINPALNKIFNQFAQELWEEVRTA